MYWQYDIGIGIGNDIGIGIGNDGNVLKEGIDNEQGLLTRVKLQVPN